MSGAQQQQGPKRKKDKRGGATGRKLRGIEETKGDTSYTRFYLVVGLRPAEETAQRDPEVLFEHENWVLPHFTRGNPFTVDEARQEYQTRYAGQPYLTIELFNAKRVGADVPAIDTEDGLLVRVAAVSHFVELRVRTDWVLISLPGPAA